MSQKELQRVKVIENAVKGRITVAEAAQLLGRSERQIKRLKKRYQPEGVDWVRHGNRGGSKPWRLAEPVRRQIVELAKGKYRGFNDTHLQEMLAKAEGVKASRETMRRILRQAGVASPQKRRPRKYRSRRPRRPQMGQMLLADASPHDWLEGRGPYLTLLGFMDDASSRALATRFQLEGENTAGYLRELRKVVENYGVPLSVYRDQHGTFQRNDTHWTLEEELAGRQEPTQLGRAMEELGIQQIIALSPQAKGRIERMWRTFQDRLISLLRLEQVSTPEHANAVLERFLPEHNEQFGVEPVQAGSAFRPLDRRLNLDRILCLRYERVVGPDHVVSFGSQKIQLPPQKGGRGYAGSEVQLCHQPDGRLEIYLGQQWLHTVPAMPDQEAVRARPMRRDRSKAKPKVPRVYVLGGRLATAIRP